MAKQYWPTLWECSQSWFGGCHQLFSWPRASLVRQTRMLGHSSSHTSTCSSSWRHLSLRLQLSCNAYALDLFLFELNFLILWNQSVICKMDDESKKHWTFSCTIMLEILKFHLSTVNTCNDLCKILYYLLSISIFSCNLILTLLTSTLSFFIRFCIFRNLQRKCCF